MKVFLICGKAGHGKTLFGDCMQSYAKQNNKNVLRIAFADCLKFICTKYFGYKGIKDEAGRTVLQHVGTDIVRKHFPNFWADLVAQLCYATTYEDGHSYDAIIVDDFRFPNEAEAFYKYFKVDDVILIQVRRGRFKNNEWIPYVNPIMSDANKNHMSETALENYAMNYVITNESVDELCESAFEILEILQVV